MSDDDGSGEYSNLKKVEIGHTRNTRNRKSSKNKKEKIERVTNDFFNGATSARTDDPKFFPDIQFIEGSENRPAIVFPDGHIFLETFSPFYSRAVDFIVAIADPCSRPRYMQEYQISPYSLFAAVSIGLSAEEIIRVLSLISKIPLTEEFKHKLTVCCRSVGKLKLVLKDQRYYIESRELNLLQDLLREKFFAEKHLKPREGERTFENTGLLVVEDEEVDAIISGVGDASYYGAVQRLTEGFDTSMSMDFDKIILKPNIYRFEIDPASVNKIREYAVLNNKFLSDEYDFMHDSSLRNLGAELRAETNIRPYQEKALSKMFAGGRAKSGIIVLPCGAGKTLVGITAVATINKSAVVVCNSVEPVKQWQRQFQIWTTINMKNICLLTSQDKKPLPEGPCVLITTYGMLTANTNRTAESKKIIDQITNRDWGILVMDEVQEAAAKSFRRVTEVVKAHTKLGLTATMVREDQKIDDLKYLVGPKLYEANWIELAEAGYLARVKCFEIIVPMTQPFYKAYLQTGTSNANRRKILAAANPNKILMMESLLQYHEARGDKILMFCDYLDLLIALKNKTGRAALWGDVSNDEKTKIFNMFRSGNKVNTIIISRIGDKAIDLPSANVLIQICSLYGSRMQESQRLGRVLRPKQGKTDEYNAFFYTLVSNDTNDILYSAKRQAFLVDQGYSYEPVTNGEERWPPLKERFLDSPQAQKEWLDQMMRIDDIRTDEKPTEEALENMKAIQENTPGGAAQRIAH